VSAEDGASVETLARRLHRLVLDIHDGPMQDLAVVGFGFGDLRRRLRVLLPLEHQPRIDAGLEQIADGLGKVERELRALIGGLEDRAVKSVPLREAIETEIGEFERRCGVRVEFVFDEDARVETDSQRIALELVPRGALANVANHARASRVVIRLHRTSAGVRLEIEDNGRGFRTDRPPEQDRLGIKGVRCRVELLGGECRVSSQFGGPTIVTAILTAWRSGDDQRPG